MPSKREDLLIYGASGHAKVIIDAVERRGRYRIVGLLDDNPKLHGQDCVGYPILGGMKQLKQQSHKHCRLILAIGSNEARCKLQERLAEREERFARIVHPAAQIGRGVTLGPGTVVMAAAVINTDTAVGKHVIINTGATVDHDCAIGDFVHISPGAHLAGVVQVGRLAHVGIGSAVIQGIRIGEGAIIGAGAAVVADIPDRVTAAGVPARVIRQRAS